MILSPSGETDAMQEAVKHKECDAALSNRDFARMSRLIYDECGIKMPDVKRTMLEARLGRRLRSLGLHSFGEYCDYLFSREGMECELVIMIDLVTTNKTDFFREPQHFDHMLLKVLPDWASNGNDLPERKFKVWSAGCSTGEEPYTLAMVLNEFALEFPGFDYSVLATDISTRVLETAMRGVYEEEKIEPVPQPLKRKYLLRSKERASGLVRIAPEIRAKVRFRRLNFMDADFGITDKFDIIFCRNVVIYFDRPTQERLLNKFCGHLATGGYVFMGHSETLNGLDVPLAMTHPTVYRKTRKVA
jgi:chemotaxis protein methyltransferase CheR